MKEIKKKTSMTYEEVLENPSLAHFHEAIHLLQNRSHNNIFPEQYESSVMSVAEGYVIKLLGKNPQISLKAVVAKVIAHFPDDLSADLISKMTHTIIEKWTQLSATHKAHEEIEVCA